MTRGVSMTSKDSVWVSEMTSYSWKRRMLSLNHSIFGGGNPVARQCNVTLSFVVYVEVE